MLNDFLSGKRSYVSKPGELKVEMEEEGRSKLPKSREGKSRREGKEKAENRKIATES